jgi:hypothetical protein
MASASASVQIALAVKTILDGYNLPQISNAPNMLTVKEFTVKFCQIGAAVKATMRAESLATCRGCKKEYHSHSWPTQEASRRKPRVSVFKERGTHQVQGLAAGGRD